MTEETLETSISPAEAQRNWRVKVLAVGGLVGAILGLGAAYLMMQRAEKEDRPLVMNTTEGIKLGLLALGTLRQVAQLGSSDKS
jgi:hypothetical protein